MDDPLVLLPGTMCDARLYWPQILRFGADRTISVIPMSGAASTGDLADRVLASAPPRFALAGHSLGGHVAMEVIQRAPERVSRIALIATAALPDTPQVSAAREPHIVAAQAGRFGEILRAELAPRMVGPGPDRGEIVQMAVDMGLRLGAEGFVAQSRALQRRPDHVRTLRGIRVPALVLCGSEDAIAAPRRHESMAGFIPGASLCLIPGAGHLVTLEDPRAVNAALAAWLESPATVRRSLTVQARDES